MAADVPPVPPDPATRVTVLTLQAENVRRLTAVRIEGLAPTGIVTIAGDNDQGKTTVLDCIVAAVDHRRLDWVEPVRTGQPRARDRVELQDARGRRVFTLERRWTAGGSTELTVRDHEDLPIKSPQQFLHGLLGAGIGTDPAHFATRSPADQVDALLRVLHLPEDPRAIDLERARAYALRTVAQRELTQAQALHATQPAPPAGTPEVPVSLADLAGEMAELQATRTRWETQQRAVEEATRDVVILETELARVMDRLGAARRILATLPAPPDEAAVRARLAAAEATNAAVQIRQAAQASAARVAAARARVDDLTGTITACDARKRQLLADAHFPVPGLGFAEIDGTWHVTYEGHALQDSATSVKLRVGLAMALADNPRLRVVLLREAAFLDQANRAMLTQWAQEHGAQIWIELVGDHPGAFTIVDGAVIPPAPPPTP